MKKWFLIFFILFSIQVLTVFSVSADDYTMSWDFRIFDNPNARQVAINIAEKQEGMVEENQDPIERFRESFERRLLSTVQRSLIDQILGEEDLEESNFQTNDLDINVREDPDTGDVILEITDLNTGETTIINYSSDEWPTDYDY
ncbi:MAG: curli assembly protein CsgF [Halanaerobium sp.]